MVWPCLKKLNIESPYDSDSTPTCTPKGVESRHLNRFLYTHVHSSQKVETAQMSFDRFMNGYTHTASPHTGPSLSHEKQSSPDTRSHVDGP